MVSLEEDTPCKNRSKNIGATIVLTEKYRLSIKLIPPSLNLRNLRRLLLPLPPFATNLEFELKIFQLFTMTSINYGT